MSLPMFTRRHICTLLLTSLLAACSSSGSEDAIGDDSVLRRHVAPPSSPQEVAAAAIFEDDALSIYVCGAAGQEPAYTRWFFSMPVRADGSFEGSADDWDMRGVIADGEITATMFGAADDRRDFVFDAVEDGSGAGLYTQRDGACQAGLIAWEDGAAPGGLGFRGAWCDGAGEFGQVIILQPEAFTAEGGEGVVDGRDEVGTLSLVPF